MSQTAVGSHPGRPLRLRMPSLLSRSQISDNELFSNAYHSKMETTTLSSEGMISKLATP